MDQVASMLYSSGSPDPSTPPRAPVLTPGTRTVEWLASCGLSIRARCTNALFCMGSRNAPLGPRQVEHRVDLLFFPQTNLIEHRTQTRDFWEEEPRPIRSSRNWTISASDSPSPSTGEVPKRAGEPAGLCSVIISVETLLDDSRLERSVDSSSDSTTGCRRSGCDHFGIAKEVTNCEPRAEQTSQTTLRVALGRKGAKSMTSDKDSLLLFGKTTPPGELSLLLGNEEPLTYEHLAAEADRTSSNEEGRNAPPTTLQVR